MSDLGDDDMPELVSATDSDFDSGSDGPDFMPDRSGNSYAPGYSDREMPLLVAGVEYSDTNPSDEEDSCTCDSEYETDDMYSSGDDEPPPLCPEHDDDDDDESDGSCPGLEDGDHWEEEAAPGPSRPQSSRPHSSKYGASVLEQDDDANDPLEEDDEESFFTNSTSEHAWMPLFCREGGENPQPGRPGPQRPNPRAYPPDRNQAPSQSTRNQGQTPLERRQQPYSQTGVNERTVGPERAKADAQRREADGLAEQRQRNEAAMNRERSEREEYIRQMRAREREEAEAAQRATANRRHAQERRTRTRDVEHAGEIGSEFFAEENRNRDRLRKQKFMEILADNKAKQAIKQQRLGRCCARPGSIAELHPAPGQEKQTCMDKNGYHISDSDKYVVLECSAGCKMYFHKDCWSKVFLPSARMVFRLPNNWDFKDIKTSKEPFKCMTDGCSGFFIKAEEKVSQIWPYPIHADANRIIEAAENKKRKAHEELMARNNRKKVGPTSQAKAQPSNQLQSTPETASTSTAEGVQEQASTSAAANGDHIPRKRRPRKWQKPDKGLIPKAPVDEEGNVALPGDEQLSAIRRDDVEEYKVDSRKPSHIVPQSIPQEARPKAKKTSGQTYHITQLQQMSNNRQVPQLQEEEDAAKSAPPQKQPDLEQDFPSLTAAAAIENKSRKKQAAEPAKPAAPLINFRKLKAAESTLTPHLLFESLRIKNVQDELHLTAPEIETTFRDSFQRVLLEDSDTDHLHVEQCRFFQAESALAVSFSCHTTTDTQVIQHAVAYWAWHVIKGRRLQLYYPHYVKEPRNISFETHYYLREFPSDNVLRHYCDVPLPKSAAQNRAMHSKEVASSSGGSSSSAFVGAADGASNVASIGRGDGASSTRDARGKDKVLASHAITRVDSRGSHEEEDDEEYPSWFQQTDPVTGEAIRTQQASRLDKGKSKLRVGAKDFAPSYSTAPSLPSQAPRHPTTGNTAPAPPPPPGQPKTHKAKSPSEPQAASSQRHMDAVQPHKHKAPPPPPPPRNPAPPPPDISDILPSWGRHFQQLKTFTISQEDWSEWQPQLDAACFGLRVHECGLHHLPQEQWASVGLLARNASDGGVHGVWQYQGMHDEETMIWSRGEGGLEFAPLNGREVDELELRGFDEEGKEVLLAYVEPGTTTLLDANLALILSRFEATRNAPPPPEATTTHPNSDTNITSSSVPSLASSNPLPPHSHPSPFATSTHPTAPNLTKPRNPYRDLHHPASGILQAHPLGSACSTDGTSPRSMATTNSYNTEDFSSHSMSTEHEESSSQVSYPSGVLSTSSEERVTGSGVAAGPLSQGSAQPSSFQRGSAEGVVHRGTATRHSSAQHSAALHSSAQHSAVLRSSAQHSATPHSSAQHDATPHSSAQHDATPHSSAQHSATPHSSAQHSATPHSSAQHSATPHSSAQHSATPHSSAQHSATPHSSSRARSAEVAMIEALMNRAGSQGAMDARAAGPNTINGAAPVPAQGPISRRASGPVDEGTAVFLNPRMVQPHERERVFTLTNGMVNGVIASAAPTGAGVGAARQAGGIQPTLQHYSARDSAARDSSIQGAARGHASFPSLFAPAANAPGTVAQYLRTTTVIAPSYADSNTTSSYAANNRVSSYSANSTVSSYADEGAATAATPYQSLGVGPTTSAQQSHLTRAASPALGANSAMMGAAGASGASSATSAGVAGASSAGVNNRPSLSHLLPMLGFHASASHAASQARPAP